MAENAVFSNKNRGSPGVANPVSNEIKSINAKLLFKSSESVKREQLFNMTFNQKRRERKRQAYLSRLWRMSEARPPHFGKVTLHGT